MGKIQYGSRVCVTREGVCGTDELRDGGNGIITIEKHNTPVLLRYHS